MHLNVSTAARSWAVGGVEDCMQGDVSLACADFYEVRRRYALLVDGWGLQEEDGWGY